MKLLSLDMGDCILISNFHNSSSQETKKELVLTCWPSTHLEPSQISLNKQYTSVNGLKFDEANLVLIQKLNKTKISLATQINVEFMPSLSNASLFVSSKTSENEEQEHDLELIASFLKEIHTNKHVVSKQMVYVHYMGQILVFKVNSVGKQSEKRALNDIESIANRLNESLKLDYNGNKVAEGKGFIENELKPVKVEGFGSSNDGYSLITGKTEVCIMRESNEEKVEDDAVRKYMFKDVGGLEKEIELLKELFISPFEFGDLYKRIGAVVLKFF